MDFRVGQIWEAPRIKAEIKITRVCMTGVSFMARDTSDNWKTCTEWDWKVLEQFLKDHHFTLKEVA